MDSRFWSAFGNWQTIVLDLALLLGTCLFLKLPKEKKGDSAYWLPFLILSYFAIYHNFGGYTNYNYEFKKAVNAYLGNTENPKFNLWLFNIAERQILAILYLLLIKSWLGPSMKKYVDWMIMIFVAVALTLQISGIELMYTEQPIIFAIGANMILVACGLYFIGLITNENYLQSQPTRLLSFWGTTVLLFYFSLTYIYAVTLLYLYRENPTLGKSLANIKYVMQVIKLCMLLLLIAAPFLTKFFDREPLHDPA